MNMVMDEMQSFLKSLLRNDYFCNLDIMESVVIFFVLIKVNFYCIFAF